MFNKIPLSFSAGLAIAGKGGVASSKPVGTAVVGPGGLAVARPIATAIAGVNPNEISSLGLPLPAKLKNLEALGSRDSTASFPTKGKYGLLSLSDDDNINKLLVGPAFFAQARRSDDVRTKDDDDEITSSEENSTYDESAQKPFINSNSDNQDAQIDADNPYGYPFEYNKQPSFQPAFEIPYNYLPYYLPPYNPNNIPFPLHGQYLQRRTLNPNLRYAPHTPQVISAPIVTPYGRFVFVQ